MTVKEAKNYRLGHPNLARGQTEAFGDSDRGIIYFAKKGKTRVDGNALLSIDEEPMAAHYEKFMRHGFVRIGGYKMNKNLGISQFFSVALAKNFWTRIKHYRISPSIDQVKLAFSLGLDYEFELKCFMNRRVAHAFMLQVNRLLAQYPKRKFLVKVYNNRKGKAMWLKPWSEEGAPTLITTHTPFRRTDKNAEQYADEYRGFKPRWV